MAVPPDRVSGSNSFIRFIRRKIYQYEVTYSLYMLTPMEKFIFNTFMLSFFSMLMLAATFYLPQHIATIASRAWFYLVGDEEEVVAGAGAGAGEEGGWGFGSAGVEKSLTTAVVERVVETVVAGVKEALGGGEL